MRTLNLGILAHVDAGKTTLTERLLFAAGVINEIGSVDAGTTKTDSLDLERRRGITIKAASCCRRGCPLILAFNARWQVALVDHGRYDEALDSLVRSRGEDYLSLDW